MQVRILVQVQLLINKAIDRDGNCTAKNFRPKGGMTYIFPVDCDTIMYMDQEEVVEVISTLLEKENNDYERVEYISHKVDFHEPVVMTGFDAEAELLFRRNTGEKV